MQWTSLQLKHTILKLNNKNHVAEIALQYFIVQGNELKKALEIKRTIISRAFLAVHIQVMNPLPFTCCFYI